MKKCPASKEAGHFFDSTPINCGRWRACGCIDSVCLVLQSARITGTPAPTLVAFQA